MMGSNLSDYTCLVPSSIEEAVAQKSEVEGLAPIAGGTEVMVLLNEGMLRMHNCQSLHRLAREWRYITKAEDGGIRIGPMATYTDVRHDPYIRKHYPLLVESSKVTGALQIQNRGTLTGNIVNGSPAADSVPVLLIYDAQLRLLSKRGERLVKLSGFYTGYRQSVLQDDELVSEIILPAPEFPAEKQYYRKVGTRAAQAISKVVFAGARANGLVRISIGSLAPVTLRNEAAEKAITSGAAKEEVWAALRQEITPIDDVRSTANYRLNVTRRILEDFLTHTV